MTSFLTTEQLILIAVLEALVDIEFRISNFEFAEVPVPEFPNFYLIDF